MDDHRAGSEQLTRREERPARAFVLRSAPLIAAALLGSVVAFSGASAVAGADNGNRSAEPDTTTVTAAPYKVNANGETYGSGIGYSDVPPDLVLAHGDDGQIGYVKSKDLEDPLPSSVDDALELNNSGPRVINLYADDGVTVIGKFTIGAPNGRVLSPGEEP